MALLAVQVHSNGQRQIRQVVVRSVGGCVKELYEGDLEPMALVVLTMARQPYKIVLYSSIATGNVTGFNPKRRVKVRCPSKPVCICWHHNPSSRLID